MTEVAVPFWAERPVRPPVRARLLAGLPPSPSPLSLAWAASRNRVSLVPLRWRRQQLLQQ